MRNQFSETALAGMLAIVSFSTGMVFVLIPSIPREVGRQRNGGNLWDTAWHLNALRWIAVSACRKLLEIELYSEIILKRYAVASSRPHD